MDACAKPGFLEQFPELKPAFIRKCNYCRKPYMPGLIKPERYPELKKALGITDQLMISTFTRTGMSVKVY